MNKNINILIFCCFVPFVLLAQNTGKINGQLTDNATKAIEGGIISLYQQQDSALIKVVLSENDGKFSFEQLKLGGYFFTINHLNFEDYNGSIFTLTEKEPVLNLPAIVMKNGKEVLTKEVVIKAKTPFVERKIDRTIINPDALLANAGTNALEVLEKSPGVQVDINGNISLRGKQGVLVYIDDKATYLSENDLANYLKSIPASSLGTIEIMTNPPAKYDAAGNAGIINIRLKKTKVKGLNGSITTSYGQGFYARTNNSINLNYRINKANFFTNLSYNNNGTYQDLTINRTYSDAGGTLNSIFTQRTFIKKRMKAATAKLGMDYYLNKKMTFGVVLSGFDNVDKVNTSNVAQLLNASETLQNIVNAQSPSKRNFLNGSANVNYNYKMDTLGKELIFNADYLRYDSKLQQSLLSNTYLADNSFVSRSNLLSNLPANLDIKTANIDYVNPLKIGGVVETGAKTSWIYTNNIAHFFDENDGVLTINNDFSNHFQYKENINAGYLNYRLEKKRWGIQAGLRYENTHINGYQLGNSIRKDSTFIRKYNSFFPTFYASYKLDSADKHQLGFSYGRRVDRPDYQDMNPFTYPLDRFTLYAGNPFLQPTFSNNLELSYTYKNMITSTLMFSKVRNMITETIEQSTNIFYSRPGNIGSQMMYGITLNGAIPITKWWTLQLYTELIHNNFEGTLYNQTLKNVGTHWYIGPTNQFQINDTWSAELSGNYQTKVYSAQFVLIPVGSVRMGVAKKILKNKATVKLNLNDVFYTNQPGGNIKGLYNSTANWHSYLDSRVMSISFSYRFNSGQALNARQTGSSDSEKTRVK